MTDNTPDIPLGSWLADLPDERLIRLLELRPDLAQPPPGSIAAVAARAQARQSLKAATDELDFLRLAVIDALLVLQADTAPVPVTKLLTLIGERAPEADVLDALDDLDPEDVVSLMGKMAGLYADLCSGDPSKAQIMALPLRVRQQFFTWLQTEVMSPEAGPGAGRAQVRQLPRAVAG